MSLEADKKEKVKRLLDHRDFHKREAKKRAEDEMRRDLWKKSQRTRSRFNGT